MDIREFKEPRTHIIIKDFLTSEEQEKIWEEIKENESLFTAGLYKKDGKDGVHNDVKKNLGFEISDIYPRILDSSIRSMFYYRIFQNQEIFTNEFELGLDLKVWDSGTFITSNGILIVASFLLGVILTIFWGAFSSAGKRSTIKQQNKKIKELQSSKPEPVSTYSASETISSEPHEATTSNDPFKSSN